MSDASSVVRSVALGATTTYESSVVETNYDPSAAVVDSPSTVVEPPAATGNTGQVAYPNSAQYESSEPEVTVDDDAALLTVAVPVEAATVTVNGHATKSDGKVRQFMSRGLREGYVYTYVVKVNYSVDGQEKSDSKSVKLRPGQSERVEFESPVQPVVAREVVQPADDVITVVRLTVPREAKVVLAGNPTNGEGEVRTFRTKQLKPGQQWSGYTVLVTAVVNGNTVTKERTLDVTAGSTNELNFDFVESEVAQR